MSIHPDDPCLVLYPLKDWQQLELKIGELPSLNIHTKKLSRKLIGHAIDCELDKIGRILIPSSHKNYANLNNKVILSGQGKSFEIWDERAWKDQIEKIERLSNQTEVPQEISKLSL
jgi:MraZ protein